jgi:hypothetical protein
MKRLFTFGCSFTSYSWPSWADILGLEYDDSQNWGLAGIGNRGIAERLAEAHARNHFTKDDTVIIQWSTHLRHDFYNQFGPKDRVKGWKTAGSIFNYLNVRLYDQKWLDNFFFEPAYWMHTLNHILLAQELLNSIGCTWYMTSIADLRNLGNDIEDQMGLGENLLLKESEKDIHHVAWKKFPESEFYEELIWNRHKDKWIDPIIYTAYANRDEFYWFQAAHDKKPWRELHPSPKQHALWLNTHLRPKLNLPEEMNDDQKRLIDGVTKLKEQHNDKLLFEQLMRSRKFDCPENFEWPRYYLGF